MKIQAELEEQLAVLRRERQLAVAQRLVKQRTEHDIEMLRDVHTNGVETTHATWMVSGRRASFIAS